MRLSAYGHPLRCHSRAYGLVLREAVSSSAPYFPSPT